MVNLFDLTVQPGDSWEISTPGRFERCHQNWNEDGKGRPQSTGTRIMEHEVQKLKVTENPTHFEKV